MSLTTDPARLIEKIAELAPLESMFATHGWRRLTVLLEAKQAETRNRLVLPGGVSSIEEVYAQRERLGLINWLLDLPADVAHTLAAHRQELYEHERKEE